MSSTKASSFYSGRSINGVEICRLAQEITLPEIDEGVHPLNLDYLNKLKLKDSELYYRTKMTEYKDYRAKFIIPVITLGVQDNVNIMDDMPAPKNNSALQTNSFIQDNSCIMTIPKHLAMYFTGTIPAGTEFLFVSLGGKIIETNMRIIAIYKSDKIDVVDFVDKGTNRSNYYRSGSYGTNVYGGKLL